MKFSIVIPVYNVEPYLRACLDSLRYQTFSDWEAICVDDGSSDGSSKILDEYAVDDARFKIFNVPNDGVSAARDFGLQKSTGDWIGFLDGDDSVLPNWLEIANKNISSGMDLIRMRCRLWYGEVVSDSISTFEKADYDGLETIGNWFWREMTSGGWCWLLFINRAFLIAHDLHFPMGVAMREDCIFELDMFPHLRHVRQVEFPGYLYRQRTSSAVCGRHKLDDWLTFSSKAMDAWRVMRTHSDVSISRRLFYGYQDLLFHVRCEDESRVSEAAAQVLKMVGGGLIDPKLLPWIHRFYLDLLRSKQSHRFAAHGLVRYLVTMRPRWRWLKMRYALK